MTSQQVQDLNGWMEHREIPNVHEAIAQNFCKPHALEDNLKFITQGKTCYIQSNVMLYLFLMITYIRHRRYSTKSNYFGPFHYIKIDPQDYDEWCTTPPEKEIHFSGPTSDDDASNMSNVLSVKRSRQIQVCQRYHFSACQSHQSTIGRQSCKWSPCWLGYVCSPQTPPKD